jgi:hypothetical protein
MGGVIIGVASVQKRRDRDQGAYTVRDLAVLN